jgi:hypothetical protein
MKIHSQIENALAVAVAVVAFGFAGSAAAQKLTPADAAARLSGTWTLNRELSPGFRAPGGRPGGPGRGGGALFSAAPTFAPQRGGGGGAANSPSDLSPDELAAQAAMRQLQQLADEITINATADKVTFIDTRGERTYTLDGKNAKITVAGSEVSTKSRWDKSALRQEFSTTSAKLTQTWDVDSDGRLVLTAKVESLRLRTPEQKAVFDKKSAH